MKVSVIVPVYNVEKYLEKCLFSLVNQTMKDIEIIVVNDGSPDNSQKIIDSFKEKYPNLVKSFIKENGGLSEARNYGVARAIGEYIAFLDSDDFVETNIYETMYLKAKQGNFDMVVCDLNYVDEQNHFVKHDSGYSKDLIGKAEIKNSFLDNYPVAWNKIYKRELFDKGVSFKRGVWYEDVEFLYRLFPEITSIGVVKESLINYLQRAGAITKTFDERLFHYIDNWNGIVEHYKKRGIYNEYHGELEYCYVRYLYGTFIKNATNYKDKSFFDKAVLCAQQNVKKTFPNYRLNIRFYKTLKGLYLILFNKYMANVLYFKKRVNR